jgi:hypothetical protein
MEADEFSGSTPGKIQSALNLRYDICQWHLHSICQHFADED